MIWSVSREVTEWASLEWPHLFIDEEALLLAVDLGGISCETLQGRTGVANITECTVIAGCRSANVDRLSHLSLLLLAMHFGKVHLADELHNIGVRDW